jgi:F0F1-type ATP synthase membrane subunit b/b'
MATQEPGRELASSPALAALPRVEDLPASGGGLDSDAVREAFDTFRRHVAQLQAQLRVAQAARSTTQLEPLGHAVRMDALHMIRAAAEFADTIERDAQQAAATQIGAAEEDVRSRRRELQDMERELELYRQETERQRAEIVNAARAEAKELVGTAERDAAQEMRDAESRATRLVEQARHQATELTNAARAEVEQTLDWARRQATTVLARAQEGAEQLLRAAGLDETAMGDAVQSIMGHAEEAPEPAAAAAPPVTQPAPAEPSAPAEDVAELTPPPPPPLSDHASEEPASAPEPEEGPGEGDRSA